MSQLRKLRRGTFCVNHFLFGSELLKVRSNERILTCNKSMKGQRRVTGMGKRLQEKWLKLVGSFWWAHTKTGHVHDKACRERGFSGIIRSTVHLSLTSSTYRTLQRKTTEVEPTRNVMHYYGAVISNAHG